MKGHESIMQKENILQKNGNLDEQILKILSDQPGLKAKEIAKILGTDRNHINHVLYGALKSKCVQDDKYSWYLMQHVRELQNLLKMHFFMKGKVEIGKTADIEITEEGINFNDCVRQFEKDLLLKALKMSGGVKNRAAKLLSHP